MFLENSGFRFFNNHLFPINADASILNLNQTVIHHFNVRPLFCTADSYYLSRSINIPHTISIPKETRIVFSPISFDRFPPIPAPIAKTAITEK